MISWNEPYANAHGICVCKAGAQVVCEQGFTIDRPHGFAQDGLFIHFKSEIRLVDASGARICKPGACVLYTPGASHFYTGVKGGFCHDWFHFSGPRTLPLLSGHRVPLGVVFYPRDTGFLESSVESMVHELDRKPMQWEKALALWFELFVLNLARLSSDSASRKRDSLHRRLTDLRQAVRRHPENPWTIGEMTRQVAMSKARFFSHYKRIYGISPMEDVALTRLQRAAWLLANEGALPVKEVALATGINDPAYFSRCFVSHFGCPPLEYRRKYARKRAG
jgi:AraC-like DNA-binding protein